MDTVAELLDALGGPAVIAEGLRLPYTTVNSWKVRGSLPIERWPDIITLAGLREIHVSLDALARMHLPKSAPDVPASQEAVA